jgi:hypothetical protein
MPHTQYAGARFLSCEIEVMRSLATRFAGKSFPRAAKIFRIAKRL